MKARVIAGAAVSLILMSGTAIAQMTLSGATMWVAQADGSNDGVTGYGNTLGSASDGGIFNVYVFTGSTASPVFLNSGNTNASLNPNLTLSAGPNVISFALQDPNAGAVNYVGLNLYFDGDLANNRISVFVPYDGTSSFAVINSGLNTIGEGNYGFLQPGSGSLSWSANSFLMTVTDMTAGPATPNLVDAFDTEAVGSTDLFATLTLTVVAVPEPASLGLIFGITLLFGAGLHRRKTARR